MFNDLVKNKLKLFCNEIFTKELTKYQEIIIEALGECQISSRKDIIAKFGKTEDRRLSYLIPMMYYINKMSDLTQIIIIVNDNQEALNIFNLTKEYAKLIDLEVLLINNFSSIVDQSAKLKRKNQIVISVMSMLHKHLELKTINLNEVKIFIIDKMEDYLEKESDVLALYECTRALSKNSSKWLFCNYELKNQIQDFNKEFMSNPINVTSNNGITFNNLKYFYLPVSSNHKLSSLISILDSIYENSKICIITKKSSESSELSIFLNCLGFSAINIDSKLSEENLNKFSNKNIFIIESENYSVIANINNINYVISLNACLSLKECLEKSQIIKNSSDTNLIELVNKSNQDFIDSLKQYNSVSVSRFVFSTQYDSKDFKLSRFKGYFSILSKEDNSKNENLSKVNEILESLSENEKNNLLKNIILNLNSCIVPSFEFDKTFNNDVRPNTVKITLSLKSEPSEAITDSNVSDYLENIVNVQKENISSINISENKIFLELKNIVKNDFCTIVKESPLNGSSLEIESIIVVDSQQRYGSNSSYSKPYEKRGGYDNRRSGGYSGGGRSGGYSGGGSGYSGGGSRFGGSSDRGDRPPRSNYSDRPRFSRDSRPSDSSSSSSYSANKEDRPERSSEFGEKRNYSSDRSGFSSDRPERSYSDNKGGYAGNRSGSSSRFGERKPFEKKYDDFGPKRDNRGSFRGGFKKKFDTNPSYGENKGYSKDSEY